MKRTIGRGAVLTALALFLGGANPAAATQGPVHLWAGDGNFGNTGASGNTLTAGNVGGVTLAAGRIGQAFNFNGNNQALDLGNGFVSFGTADFSVSVWVKPNSAGSNQPVFVKRSADSQGIFGLTLSPNGMVGVEIRDDQGGNPCCGYSFAGTKYVVDGQWHHLAVVRQGGTIQVYTDGAPGAGTASGNGALNLYSGNYGAPKLMIGTNPYNQYYSGLIDQFAIYDRALAAAEVQSLANPAVGGVVNWWKGENNANDAVGGINGTFNGGPTYTGGKVGNAFSFLSANQFVDLGSGVGNFGKADFSVAVWVKPYPTGDNKPVFVKRSANSQGIFGLTLAPNGTIGVEMRDDGANPCCGYSFTGTKNLADSQWHQVVLVRQGSSIQVYADGAAAAGTPGGNQALNLSSANYAGSKFIVGTNPYNQYFKGEIDELQIYSRALSAAEVSALYAQ